MRIKGRQFPTTGKRLRTFKTNMVLSPSQQTRRGRGPLEARTRRRRGSLTPGRVAVLSAAALAVFLWHGMLRGDLGSDEVGMAAPKGEAPTLAVATLPPADLAEATSPTAATIAARPAVWRVLLDVARDHVVRRVYAAWGSVMDLEAMRGADVDMIERGLAVLEFPLRAAVVRHRFREPKRYSLAGPPPATLAERRRALTPDNLQVFLEVFADTLPADIADDAPGAWAAGDIVLFSTSTTGRPLMAGVVSDRADEDGTPLLITLDPRDHVALEAHSLADYFIRQHYRLEQAHLDRCSRMLELQPLRISDAPLL